MKKKIILFGPQLHFKNASYGGGSGGYTRNMETYLEEFVSDEFTLNPCFHTVRSKVKSVFNIFFIRLLIDMKRFLFSIFKNKKNLGAVHILAQYRNATPREFIISLICVVFKIPYLYEVKAGQFDTWYYKTNKLNKLMVKFIISKSNLVLCEGKRYIPFIKLCFNKQSFYWPNFVPSKEIPIRLSSTHYVLHEPLKVCFIGYCYEGKGIFDLVLSANKFQKENNIIIELNIVGHESSEFQEFIENSNLVINLIRHGKQEHNQVLNILKSCHLFCLPTRHLGEGHNNSVNEAMMCKKAIICTKNGFLPDVLSPEKAIFIEDHGSIEEAFKYFISEPEYVKKMTNDAHEFFLEQLHSERAIPILCDYYKGMMRK